MKATSCQWAKSLGWCWYTRFSQSIALAYLRRNRLNLCMAQRVKWSLTRHARKVSSER